MITVSSNVGFLFKFCLRSPAGFHAHVVVKVIKNIFNTENSCFIHSINHAYLDVKFHKILRGTGKKIKRLYSFKTADEHRLQRIAFRHGLYADTLAFTVVEIGDWQGYCFRNMGKVQQRIFIKRLFRNKGK